MRRLLLGSFALTLLAQSPEAVQRRAVEERFASSDPVDQAWGASLAARYRLPEFIPRIQSLLSLENSSAQRVAVDALIQLGAADVPTELLEKQLLTNFDPVMILLLRKPAQAEPVLLRLLDQKLTDHQWWVVHSGLIARRTPAQAAALVRDWTFRFRIRVVDAGTLTGPPAVRGRVCGVFGSFGGKYPRPDPLFIGQNRSIILTSGPHPLSYDGSDCVTGGGVDRHRFTLDYLRYLASHQVSLPGNQIEFVNGAMFAQDLAALKGKLEQYIEALRGALIDSGALNASQWRQPKLEIEASDAREIRTTPLLGVDWFI